MSEAHVVPTRVLLYVFAALIGLTAVTVAVAFQHFGALNIGIALTIATTKALLVLLIFMELRESSRLTWVVVASGVVFLVLLLGFTLSDFLSRGWLGVVGK